MTSSNDGPLLNGTENGKGNVCVGVNISNKLQLHVKRSADISGLGLSQGPRHLQRLSEKSTHVFFHEETLPSRAAWVVLKMGIVQRV